MFRFVVLSALLATSAVAEDVARQCTSAGAGELPISFEIEGCSSSPCALPQLEDAVVNVKFNAPQDSGSLRARLVINFFLNISIVYDLGADSDACRGLHASCPVKEGQELEYTLKLPIESNFPVGTSVNLELSVVDDANSSAAFCARVPVRVVAPRNVNADSVQVVN